VALVVTSVGIVVALAAYSTHSDKYAVLAAVVVLCVGLAVFEPTILPGAAIVGTLVLERIAGASTNLSMSDALLFVGTLSALIVFRSTEDRDLKALLGLVAIYEAMMVVPVLDNPYRADFIEWGHELFLAGGALICGWVVARKGHARLALGAFLVGACVISLWAAALSPLHHFHPAYLPGGYQKNAIGDLVAFATLAAYANPTYLALSPRIRRFVIFATLLGIAASQSRQAEIGLIVSILFVLHRRGGLRKQGKLIALMTVPALVYIGSKVQHQTVSTNQFNSVHQRLSWYHDSLAIFHVSPWIGVGLRWWYTNRFSFSFQPPNGELEMLTSGGLLGLCGFLILNLGALRRLRRIDWEYGTLAFAAVLMRFTQGQFDIFWVAGSAAIPWLLSGVALGARTRARQHAADDSRLAAKVRPSSVGLLELSSTQRST
jgi:hypothetical protein